MPRNNKNYSDHYLTKYNQIHIVGKYYILVNITVEILKYVMETYYR